MHKIQIIPKFSLVQTMDNYEVKRWQWNDDDETHVLKH